MRFPDVPRALALLLLSLGSTACVTRSQDLHLSPLYSNLSSAGGGREVEALAGVVRIRRPAPAADVSQWALRPLVAKHLSQDGDTYTRFLVPFGKRTTKTRNEEELTQLLPLARYHRELDREGQLESQFLMLPGILWHREPSGRVVRAFFPFGGVVEDFLTYHEIVFALFPLYIRTKRGDRTSWHFPWPFLGFAKEEGVKPSYRFWPLFGLSRTQHYDRRFFLWPIFQRHRDNLQSPPEQRFTKTMVFPLWGHARRGSFRSTSILWPFFGFARNPETGFWAFDGPWPLVRIRRGGPPADGDEGRTEEEITRTRFWPFWSHYRDSGLNSTWVLWPFMNQRHETYDVGDRRSEFIVPFWQSWGRFDDEGVKMASWNKLWPLYQRYEKGTASRTAFPAFNPLWHTPVIDDHYAWIYELYTRETEGDLLRERSWGGIWRRDVDSGEQRKYLSVLWAQRKYNWEGQTVRDTSVLFGLLRWRSRPGARFRILPPAFPGPGWPHERLSVPEVPR